MSKDTWSSADYNNNASFVYSQAFAAPVLQLLDAKPGERILDLGCGTGELDMELAKVVGDKGFILATDGSKDMIDKASSLFRNIPNLEFRVEDSAHLSPGIVPSSPTKHAKSGERQFDAVFSNAALHWILKQAPDKLAVFKAVHALLTPSAPVPGDKLQGGSGGRFVAEFGGALNIIGIRSAIWRALKARGYNAAAMDPWFFPGVEECTKLLEDAGFAVQEITQVPRITPLPGSIVPWLRTFFLGNFLNLLPPASQENDPKGYAAKVQIAEDIMAEVERDLEIDCKDEFTGKWTLMYVRMRFVAIAQV